MIRTNGISKHIVMLLAVIAALIIVAAVTGTGMAYADGSVHYLDADGNEQTAENCISTSDWPKDENYPVLVGSGEEGTWYVLDSDVTYSEYRLIILGKVNIILKDGCTLNAKRGIRMAANTPEGASLTVYAQSAAKGSMGVLIADASGVESCAGIGGNGSESGGEVVIIGGNITATGGKYAAGIGGGEDRGADNVMIKGGIVTATGGEYGAGIGGGEGGSGGNINIEDGTVTANGGSKAAGVGGGQKWSGGGDGGTIVIGKSQGTTKLDLTATAGNEAAGIGGGEDGEGGNITIYGGKVTASGNSKGRGAGIGGGVDAHAGTITINGGDVTANGGTSGTNDYSSAGGGAGIGAGFDNDSGSKSKTAGGHIIINGGKVKAVGGVATSPGGFTYSGAGIGSGGNGYGCRIEIHGGNIDASSPGLDGAGIGGGRNGAGGVISIDNKVSDPSIHVITGRGLRGQDSVYAIGNGAGYDDDWAEVTFDYPDGKVWIEWYFSGQDNGEAFVDADKRASTVAAGSGTYREIRITPCEHSGMTMKEADGGHKYVCGYCSKFDGAVFPHNYIWSRDEQSHKEVCLDCGAVAENGDHTYNGSDKCVKCGFDKGFKMNQSELPLNEGGSGMIRVISSLIFTDDNIEWSSSDEDEKVVKVSGGGDRATITAVREGTAVITARAQTTSGADVECECLVTVKHVHRLVKKQDEVKPTCTEKGQRAFYICEDETYGCNRFFFDEEGTKEFDPKDVDLNPPALGHDWSEWEIVKEPTQREAGSMKRKCGSCGEEQTITTAKADAAVLRNAISKVDDAKAGIASSEDGSDIEPAEKWAPQSAFDALEEAYMKARQIEKNQDSTQQQINDVADELDAAIQTFTGAVRNGTMGPKAEDVEKAIMAAKSNEGPAGTMYAPLRLRSTKQTKKSVTLTWNKAAKAVRYTIYGNITGSKNKFKKVASVSGSTKSKVIKKAGSKLKKGKYYKFLIIGIDSNDRVISMSKVAHVATKGGKAGNYKSVTISKSVVTKAGKLKSGNKLTLKAKAVKASKLKVKKLRVLRYETSDAAVASVSSKGVITAKAAGTCYVYAYAQNGVCKAVKVTVK